MRTKRFTYGLATVVAMVILLPFQGYPWAIYLAACAGYTVLVFGLRRLQQKRSAAPGRTNLPASKLLLNHSAFLVAVVAWVWLLIVLKPYMPYFLTMEDSRRPYFGLLFIGVLGILLLEMFEQRWLRAPNPAVQTSRTPNA